MTMLSELLRFDVLDPAHPRRKLADLVINQLEEDYPVVTHLILRRPLEPKRVLPWHAVETIREPARQIIIKSYDALTDFDSLETPILLRRDVLDALILDLQNRRVTRANDLWLEEENGHLRLRAAATGFRGLFRRLLLRGNKPVNPQSLYDWKYIEFLRGDPQAVKAGAKYHRRIVHLQAGEIANLTTAIPYLHAAELLELLPEQLAADTLEVIPPEKQLQVFEELDENRALTLLARMAPDIATDLVGQLPPELAQRYLDHLPSKPREQIIDLLRYPENTVGGIMTNDVILVPAQLTVQEARDRLRERLKEPDFVYFLYVVENEETRKLRGVLSLRNFLVAQDDQTIESIMNPYLLTLSPFDKPQEAAYRLVNTQLAALPVVGADGRLLGTVTIDAAVSQVAPGSWRSQAPRVFS